MLCYVHLFIKKNRKVWKPSELSSKIRFSLIIDTNPIPKTTFSGKDVFVQKGSGDKTGNWHLLKAAVRRKPCSRAICHWLTMFVTNVACFMHVPLHDCKFSTGSRKCKCASHLSCCRIQPTSWHLRHTMLQTTVYELQLTKFYFTL